MSAWFAVLLLASPWSVTEGPDSVARARPELRTVLPIRQSLEVSIDAGLTAATTPKPKFPKGHSVHYGWEHAAGLENWREWVSFGYERVEWEAPEPYRTFTVYDSLGYPTSVFYASGTRLRRFGFQLLGGFDRVLGPEARPMGTVRGGVLFATGEATVFQAGYAYSASYAQVGAIARLAGDIHLTRGASLVPAVSWSPSYVSCKLLSVKGFHQQLSAGLSLVVPMSIPKREKAGPTP